MQAEGARPGAILAKLAAQRVPPGMQFFKGTIENKNQPIDHFDFLDYFFHRNSTLRHGQFAAQSAVRVQPVRLFDDPIIYKSPETVVQATSGMFAGREPH